MDPSANHGHDPQRQLRRSLNAIFGLAMAAAIAGPVLSYQSDLAELESIIEVRLQRDAELQAQALERYLTLLEEELGHLANRSDLAADLAADVAAGNLDGTAALLAGAKRDSTLRDTGLSLLDADGRVLWTDWQPAQARPGQGPPPTPARTRITPVPAAIVLDVRARTALVPVPIVAAGEARGYLVAHVDFSSARSPVFDLRGNTAIVDQRGGFILHRPAGALTAGDVETWLRDETRAQGPAPIGGDRTAVMVPIGRSGLSLLLAASRTGTFHRRFILQLVLVATVQFSAVLLLALVARAMYQRFARAELRARENATLAALGQATSLIAHEVKNSLNGMGGALSLIAMGGDTNLATKSMRGQIDRLRHLSASLLAFGKPQPPRRVPTELRPLLAETVTALRDLPEAEDVDMAIVDGPAPCLPCDPLLLATALDNLLRNAVEAGAAAKDTGRVAAPWVRAEISVSGGKVEIAVEDNAGGLAPAQRARLFEPFVTSKPKGIGLGLAMAHRALADQGGELVYQATANGSRFTVRLPVGQSTAQMGHG